MIGEKGKLTDFEEETEMAKGRVSCKEFTIKGRVLGFGGGQLLGKEGKGGTGSMDGLLQDSTNMGVGRVYSQGHGCTGDRMCEHWNGG